MNTSPENAVAIFQLISQPGIRRDGTALSSPHWTDGKWVRFQRGLPRKIGGYRSVSQQLRGPVRAVHVSSRADGNYIHAFNSAGVEQLLVDRNGVPSGSLVNRTPAAYVASANMSWQAAQMFQSGGGGVPTLIASATPDLNNIASTTQGSLYYGNVTSSGLLVPITNGAAPIQVSGGCVILQPFLFVYGNDGLIRNSNPNDISDPSGWATGGANYANTANVAATKIVKGLPVRGGGRAPAGLFWALDALIRVTFAGLTNGIWNYDTVSDDVTVLSKNGIVEYDNVYYWPGVDRFYLFDGVVRELPNAMNFNWFFDNVNPAATEKVWALKIPKFGEIWWFFPFGAATECDAAVIYNVREGSWYDARIERTAGFPAKSFKFPLMAGDAENAIVISYTPLAGAVMRGAFLTGGTSGATGYVLRVDAGQLFIGSATGTFQVGEVAADSGGANTVTVTAAPAVTELTSLWQHEIGVDQIIDGETLAVDSYIQSAYMQWMTGGPVGGSPGGPNYQLRLSRLEPDFVQTGDLTLTVSGVSYAQGDVAESEAFTLAPDTNFFDLREQRRELAVKFRSNTQGGDFQMGKVLLTASPGDESG